MSCRPTIFDGHHGYAGRNLRYRQDILRYRQDIFLNTNTWANFRLVYLSGLPVNKVLAAVVGFIAGIAFFGIAIKYAPVRRLKTAQYLSSMVTYSTIYLGLARFFEIFYMVGESDLGGLVYVAAKWYYPLDVVGCIFLVIVAFNIFILPGMDDSAQTKNSTFLVTFCWLLSIVIILALSFYYVGLIILPFAVAVVGIAMIMFLIVAITVLVTSVKIFKVWSKTDDPVSRKALFSLGIQLIFGVIVILLFITHELGTVFSIDYYTGYLIRCVKELFFLAIALLFIPSLIRPSQKIL
jgi:hypothetical protein